MGIKAIKWCWKQQAITSTQKLVLLCLSNYYNDENGKCYPSVKTISLDCRLGETAVKKALNELEETSLIKKIERKTSTGRNRSNVYVLNLDVVLTEEGVVKRPHMGSPSDHEPEIYNKPYPTDMGVTAIDAFLEEPTPKDNRKDFWDEAVGMMMAMGVVEVTARPFIGRILGWTRGDMAEALRVIDQALQAGTNNPIQYIAAIFTKKGTGKADKKKEMDELFAKLQEASDARRAQWAAEEAAANAGGGGDEDTGVLPEREFDEPASVHADTHKRSGEVPAKRVAEVVRPAGGHLSDM